MELNNNRFKVMINLIPKTTCITFSSCCHISWYLLDNGGQKIKNSFKMMIHEISETMCLIFSSCCHISWYLIHNGEKNLHILLVGFDSIQVM